MSDQTIQSAGEAPKGNAVRAGGRGGLYYQDTGGEKDGKSKGKPKGSGSKPDYVASGPGYDIGFFKKPQGFRVRYKGPNADPILKKVEELVKDGTSIEEAISKVRSE